MSSFIPLNASSLGLLPQNARTPIVEPLPTTHPPQDTRKTVTSSLEELFTKKSSIPDNLKPFLPQKVDFFIGRKPELETLQQTLRSSGVAVLIPHEAIPCKIGKSLIARHYASRQACVYWIPAKNKETLETSYQQLAHQLKLEPFQVKDYLSQQEGLVIFDGVQDSEALQSYLPQGKCHVLITSRKRDWNLPKTEVGALSPEDGAVFLCQATGKQDRETAKKISETLDGLPTSLTKAVKILGSEELKAYFNLRNQQLEQHAQKLKFISNLGSRNPNFTGREMALVALEETLKSGSRAVITGKRKVAAEIGLGGVGKTQIALQYAFRNAERYPFFVWWINCENEMTRHTSYETLAKKLGIFLSEEEKKGEHALIKKVNARLERERDWLLICDNVENQKFIEGLVPKTGGHVLITSRNPDWNTGFARVFPVGLFTREESIALIQKMTSLTSEEACQLADLVGNLPIAVAQAAAYIERTDTSFKEYEQLFKDKSQELLPNQRPTDDHSKTVNITWILSMDKIKEIEKKEADALYAPLIVESLMNLCAFLDSKNIPRDNLLLTWVRHTYGREEAALEDLNRALRLLRAFSMIDLEEASISVHLLVQCVTRGHLDNLKRKETCEAAIKFLHAKFIFQEQENNQIRKNLFLIAHVEKLIDHAWSLQVGEKLALVLKDRTAHYLRFQGVYNQAIAAWNRCLEKSQSFPEDISFGIRMNLGQTLRDLGLVKEAQEQYTKALSKLNDSDPAHHNPKADVCYSLGVTFCDVENYQGAEELFKAALLLYKIFPDINAHKIASVKVGLAGALRGLKNYTSAERELREAINIKEHISNHSTFDQISIAGSRVSLAAILRDLMKYSEAKAELVKSLGVYSKVYDPNHHYIIEARINLAAILLELKDYENAEKQYKQALLSAEKADPPLVSPMSYALSGLGSLYQEQKKYLDAKEQFDKVLQIKEQIYPTDHPSLADTRTNLAGICEQLKQYTNAKEHLEKALTIYKKAYPINQSIIRRTEDNLRRILLTIELQKSPAHLLVGKETK